MDIRAWLRELGLERYQQAFRANDIDANLLRGLTSDDLKELGVASLGHRKLMLEAIAALDLSADDDPDQTATLGSDTATPATIASRQAPRPEAERRQLTVMFVDLVGSTALSSKLDPEEMGGIVRAYQNAVAGEITRFEGHIAKYMGDGVLAYFGWPRAHEDEAERAVRAALSVVEAVSQLSTLASDALSCRIGIATGLVVVGELIGEGAAQEETVVGDTPNLAARLQALAQPGQVVIAEGTRALVVGSFRLNDLGRHDVKGLDAAVPASSVLGEVTTESRFEARSGPSLLPMIGREQELALLLQRWELAAAGEGQGVLLVGEAGIGKSRITTALLGELAGAPHTRIRYQCSPYHSDSPLWPVVQQLGRAADIDGGATPDAKLDRLETLLAAAGEVADAAPLIAALIGLDGTSRYGTFDMTPQAQRARTLEVLTGQLIGLAARQPVLLMIEDAHWVDPTTLELIEQSLDRIADARVLVLMTSRPDHQPQLAGHPHVTRLTLNRLGRGGVQDIVTRLGGEGLPAATIDAIIARTDGVPLFVEELTKAIIETGEQSIPASLHDSLMARLDRLPDVKEVAQIAACIGREFDFALLEAIGDRPQSDLIAALDRLAGAELIFRRGVPPNASYTFKHALVRDAAYESLLKSRRQRVHLAIVEQFEFALSELVADQPEIMAHHLAAAGRPDRAAPYWHQAGQLAARKSANSEAAAYLGRALDTVRALPPSSDRDSTELDVLMSYGPALIAIQGFGSLNVKRAFEQAEVIGDRLGDHGDRFRILRGLWNADLFGGSMGVARERGQELLKVAEKSGKSSEIVEAHRVLTTISFVVGDFAHAIDHTDKCNSIYNHDEHRHLALIYGADPSAASYCYGSLAQWMCGYPVRAKVWSDQGLQLAQRLALGHGEAIALWFQALLAMFLREHDVVERTSSTSVDMARNFNVTQFQVWSEVCLGWSKAMQGEAAAGIDVIESALVKWRKMQQRYMEPHMCALLAEAEMAAGNWQRAKVILSDTRVLAEQTGERFWLAELHRMGAVASLQLCDTHDGDIEAQLRRAMEVAANQQAKSFELRAARDLARLWAERGERQKALDLLTPVYDWFTEGFDTPDLIEAKALLDELG